MSEENRRLCLEVKKLLITKESSHGFQLGEIVWFTGYNSFGGYLGNSGQPYHISLLIEKDCAVEYVGKRLPSYDEELLIIENYKNKNLSWFGRKRKELLKSNKRMLELQIASEFSRFVNDKRKGEHFRISLFVCDINDFIDRHKSDK